jgi:hypothetical protein
MPSLLPLPANMDTRIKGQHYLNLGNSCLLSASPSGKSSSNRTKKVYVLDIVKERQM